MMNFTNMSRFTNAGRGFITPSEKQHESTLSCSSSERGTNALPRGFTTKRAERRANVLMSSSEASAGREAVRGFTLVETLVAIAVIATAITGPLYAVQQSLNASRTARDQLIASALAQEGVEFVRNTRDSNYIWTLNGGTARNWLAGFDGTSASGSIVTAANCISTATVPVECVIDPYAKTVSRTVAPLKLTSGKIYSQGSSGTVTPYTRTVTFKTVPVGAAAGTANEMTVTVTVSWTTKENDYQIVIVESLHNWL